MSQYSVSLRAYIHMLDKYKNNSATFADYAKKVIFGRSLFFSFDYAGDEEFKQLFEESFINKYFDCDVAYEDFNRFLFKLKTDTQRKAPVYYKMYTDVKNAENMLKRRALLKRQTKARANTQRTAATRAAAERVKTKAAALPFQTILKTLPILTTLNIWTAAAARKAKATPEARARAHLIRRAAANAEQHTNTRATFCKNRRISAHGSGYY